MHYIVRISFTERAALPARDVDMIFNERRGYGMKAYVDKDTCIGCGLCTEVCPDVFSMDDDGLAVAIDEEIPEDAVDCAQDAQQQCPTGAISIE